MKLLTVLAAVLVGSLAYPSKEQLHAQWNTFKATHQKSYNTIEEFRRINIFKENVRKIEEHNKLYEKGQSSYKMGINQFADMTRSEFLKYLTRHKKNPMTQVNTIKYQRHYLELPENVDWRNEGAVTGVKNQAQCGSCWAFSTTGSLEGQNFLKNGVLVSLSEQELVDCSHENNNAGCDGGLMESGFEYVIKHGLSTEDEYPYEATDGRCRRGSLPSAVTATNYVVITPGDEEELKEAVATVGPIAVSIDASEWQFYESGILEDPDCSPDYLNHGVLGVGYGTENGQDYWLVKNSWGPDWGENGYIRTARNANNNCGVASDSSYPIL